MCGANEETLLSRRGEKGDDFWRRFSMVAKIEKRETRRFKRKVKHLPPPLVLLSIPDHSHFCLCFISWWLKKAQNGSSRLSRWVWAVAFVILLCITDVSVLGWQASHNKPAHQAPTALGDSANVVRRLRVPARWQLRVLRVPNSRSSSYPVSFLRPVTILGVDLCIKR